MVRNGVEHLLLRENPKPHLLGETPSGRRFLGVLYVGWQPGVSLDDVELTIEEEIGQGKLILGLNYYYS